MASLLDALKLKLLRNKYNKAEDGVHSDKATMDALHIIDRMIHSGPRALDYRNLLNTLLDQKISTGLISKDQLHMLIMKRHFRSLEDREDAPE